MSSPLDPIRRSGQPRRLRKARTERAEAAPDGGVANLPVPVGPAETIPPTPEPPLGGSAFDAQLLGQAGQKRGLRAGPSVIGAATASYNKTEWSGSKDRRRRKGRIAKTEI